MVLKNCFIGGAILLLAGTDPSSSLNFDLAVDLDMFDSVVGAAGDDFLAFSPNKDAAHAWMYANSAEDTSINLTARISGHECDSQSDGAAYNDEISVMILKYNFGSYTGNWTRGMVRVGVDDGTTNRWFEVTMERLNPEATDVVEGQHLFTTWMFETPTTSTLPWSPKCANKSITVEMTDWQPDSEIYFVSTIHRRLRNRNIDGVSSCPYAEEFGCVEDVGEHQLCILRDPLTCNLLPNCAQKVIPNNDEKCTWGWSFDDALRAMVFTLAAVCTILLCIGCIRTCVIRSLRRRNNSVAAEASDNGDGSAPGRRRRVSFLDYVSSSLPRRRPANAPPTYDDAVKNDNEAFEWEEPPPEYHERTTQWEQEENGAAAAAPVSVVVLRNSGAETGNSERSESPCSSRPLEQLVNNVLVATSRQRTRSSRGPQVTLTPLPPQTSETEVVGGEELPTDPPSYEIHHRHEEEDGSRESERVENQDPSSTSVQRS